MSTQKRSSLAVVIPAYNASSELHQCLSAIQAGTVQPDEIIVVDDGSTDDTRQVAVEFGATILSTGGRCGPAFARNLGAAKAVSDIVFFLDADVCAHPTCLEKCLANFENPDVHAVIGSYDSAPACQQFLSQYRNLMHHYVHQISSRQATTFWSGCGAVRRSVFLKMRGFDASYIRPAIEDIELGYRLHNAGYNIVLDAEMMVKHLKTWTLQNMVKTDVFDRGIPWTRLILRAGRMPNDLNLKWHQRVSVLLAGLLLLLCAVATFQHGGTFLTPLAGVLLLTLGSFWVTDAVAPRNWMIRVALGISLGVFSALALYHGLERLVWLLAGAYILLFSRELIALYAGRHWRKKLGWVYGAYLLVALGFMVTAMPRNPTVALLAVLLTVTVILNFRFYAFLFSQLGRLYTVSSIPFHILHHFYSGVSFVMGLAAHFWDRHVRRGGTLEGNRP